MRRAAMALLLVMASCGGPPKRLWFTNPTGTPEEFERAKAGCMRQARDEGQEVRCSHELIAQAFCQQAVARAMDDDFILCMRERGWSHEWIDAAP